MDRSTDEINAAILAIKTPLEVAWQAYVDAYPEDDDLIMIVDQATRGDDVTSSIAVVSRPALFSDASSPPPSPIAEWFAAPAGESEPRVPNSRAIWVLVFTDGKIKGSSRMIRPINAPGGVA